MRVSWAPDGVVRAAHQMMFGYAVEPNAGLWYILGVSAAFLIGCGFLEAAHRGLVRTRTLTTTDSRGPDPLSRVAAANRIVFRAGTPTVAVLALLFVAVPELAHRLDHAFGWVQADQAGTYVDAHYGDLKREGKIGDVPSLAALCDGCAVRVTAVFNRTDRFQPPPPAWFRVFLALALGHQVVFTAFASWIAAKVLFLFWMLSTALVGPRHTACGWSPTSRTLTTIDSASAAWTTCTTRSSGRSRSVASASRYRPWRMSPKARIFSGGIRRPRSSVKPSRCSPCSRCLPRCC